MNSIEARQMAALREENRALREALRVAAPAVLERLVRDGFTPESGAFRDNGR